MYPDRELTRTEAIYPKPVVVINPVAPAMPERYITNGWVKPGAHVRIAESGLEYTGCFGHIARIDDQWIWVRCDLRFGLDYYPVVPVKRDGGVKLL